MILLEIMTLQPSSECYHEETYNIIDHVIKERINKINKIYTKEIADLIKNML